MRSHLALIAQRYIFIAATSQNHWDSHVEWSFRASQLHLQRFVRDVNKNIQLQLLSTYVLHQCSGTHSINHSTPAFLFRVFQMSPLSPSKLWAPSRFRSPFYHNCAHPVMMQNLPQTVSGNVKRFRYVAQS